MDFVRADSVTAVTRVTWLCKPGPVHPSALLFFGRSWDHFETRMDWLLASPVHSCVGLALLPSAVASEEGLCLAGWLQSGLCWSPGLLSH